MGSRRPSFASSSRIVRAPSVSAFLVVLLAGAALGAAGCASSSSPTGVTETYRCSVDGSESATPFAFDSPCSLELEQIEVGVDAALTVGTLNDSTGDVWFTQYGDTDLETGVKDYVRFNPDGSHDVVETSGLTYGLLPTNTTGAHGSCNGPAASCGPSRTVRSPSGRVTVISYLYPTPSKRRTEPCGWGPWEKKAARLRCRARRLWISSARNRESRPLLFAP